MTVEMKLVSAPVPGNETMACRRYAAIRRVPDGTRHGGRAKQGLKPLPIPAPSRWDGKTVPVEFCQTPGIGKAADTPRRLPPQDHPAFATVASFCSKNRWASPVLNQTQTRIPCGTDMRPERTGTVILCRLGGYSTRLFLFVPEAPRAPSSPTPQTEPGPVHS